jgi:hypothetical protein
VLSFLAYSQHSEYFLVCFVISAWLSIKWRATTEKKETGIDVFYYCNSLSLMVIVVSKSNDENHVIIDLCARLRG